MHTILCCTEINGSAVWSRANPGSSCHSTGIVVVLLEASNSVGCNIRCGVDDSVTDIELVLHDQQQVVHDDAILIFKWRWVPANRCHPASYNCAQ